MSLFSKLGPLYRALSRLLHKHYSTLFIQLDPVQDVESRSQAPPESSSSSSSKLNAHFLFACFAFFLAFLDSNLGLQYENLGHLNLAFDSLRRDRYIIFHQVVPEKIWFETDNILLLNTIITAVVLAILTFHSEWPERFKFYRSRTRLRVDDRVLNSSESNAILNFSKRCRKQIKYSAILFQIMIVNVYCYGHVFLLSRQKVYKLSLHSTFVYAVSFQIFFFYIIFITLNLMFYVIMTSKYLRIRQHQLLTNLIQINTKMTTIHFELTWRHYLTANQTLLHLCTHIRAASHFWSPLLSALFPYYITCICYLLYLGLLASHIPMKQTYIYKLILSQFVPAFFLPIHHCAGIVTNNAHILKQCRRFYINMQSYAARTRKNRPEPLKLLKAENLCISRRLHSYCFKLFTNYRITSKTFHLIAIYIASFFMAVYKH